MSRPLQKPDCGYFGHGLSIDEFTTHTNSELESLRDENQQLKEQVHYQQQLLTIWQQQACTLCQMRGSNASSTTSSARDSRAIKPSRSSSRVSAGISADEQTPASSCSSTPSTIDKAFRQQQVLIAQLQRQVMILEVELSSREELVLEADAVLAEASRRLAPLVALQEELAAAGSRSASVPASRAAASARNCAANRQTSRASQAAPAAAGGVSTSSGASAVTDRVLQHAQGLHAWCKSTTARLGRARAESADKCRAARREAFIVNSAVNGAASTPHWDARSGGASSLQQLQLQYAPPGGNRFLQPGAPLSLSHIARGQGCTALNAAPLHQLIPLLAGLAQGLATLAVQLRSIVLPAMPWLAAATAEELTSSTAVLAGDAAFAAGQLVEACSVLPAMAGTLSASAAVVARKRLVQTAAAAQEAGLWGAADRASGSNAASDDPAKAVDDVGQQVLQMDSEDASLLQEINTFVASATKAPKAGCSTDGAVARSSSSRKALSLGGSSSPSKQQQQHKEPTVQQLGSALLQQLEQRWKVLWFKKRILEQQLSFVARCSSEQAKLVGSLTHEVAAALSAAVEQSELQGGLQQRRLEAQQLVQQVQRAMLLLQQRPGEMSAGGNAVRTLVGLLQQQQHVLEDIPELLLAASAQSLKAAALAAVTAVFRDLRAGMHSAREETEALCIRLHSAKLSVDHDVQAA